MKVKKIFIALALTLVMVFGVIVMTACNGNGGDPFASPSAQLAGGGQDGAWLMTSGSFETAMRLRGQVRNWHDSTLNDNLTSDIVRNNQMAIVDGLNVNIRAFMAWTDSRQVVTFARTGNYYTGDLLGTNIRFTVQGNRAYAHIADMLTLSGGRGTMDLDEVLVFERGYPQLQPVPAVSRSFDELRFHTVWLGGTDGVLVNDFRLVFSDTNSGEELFSTYATGTLTFVIGVQGILRHIDIREFVEAGDVPSGVALDISIIALGEEGFFRSSEPVILNFGAITIS